METSLALLSKEHEKTRIRYDEVIDSYRIEHDYIWRFITTADRDVKNAQLKDMKNYLLSVHGPGKKYELTEESFATLDRIIESDDVDAKDSFFFVMLYLVPGFYQWLVSGQVEITDVEKFRRFSSTTLAIKTEALLTGTVTLKRPAEDKDKWKNPTGKPTMSISMYARDVRAEYVASNGLPEPPLSNRVQYLKQ